MKRPGVDWYSSTRCQGRELRFAFGLNSPPRLFLISHFSSFFSQGCGAVSAEFVYVFFTCVCDLWGLRFIWTKEIRSTFVYQILVHYDEEIWFDFHENLPYLIQSCVSASLLWVVLGLQLDENQKLTCPFEFALFDCFKVPIRTTLVTAPSIETPSASIAYLQGTHAIVNFGYSGQVRICVFA